MRVVVQRVREAEVRVAGRSIATIGRGLLLLVGLAAGDDDTDLLWMARKIAGLRIFEDAEGRMNAALTDVGGRVLAVPQFTLLADVRHGRRPSFTDAMDPRAAEPLFMRFVALLAHEVGPVETGCFGTTMEIRLVNDGPVTLVVDH